MQLADKCKISVILHELACTRDGEHSKSPHKVLSGQGYNHPERALFRTSHIKSSVIDNDNKKSFTYYT